MKRLVAVISGLLILPAFAEVAPVYYDAETVEYTDDVEVDDVVYDEEVAEEQAAKSDVVINPSATKPRTTRAISRVVPSATTKTAARRTAAARGVASRTTTARTATNRPVAERGATVSTRGTVSRTGGTATTRGTVKSNATRARASIVQTDTVNSPLYNGTNTNTMRVGIRANTGVASRVPTIRSASATAVTTSSVVTPVVNAADTAAAMNELTELTDYCKAQYTECMDNFCNVLDDNQGRCSCSKNLKNYEKTETALKEATIALQDVAAQIQYIGLTGKEVETLFAQTEAELKMSNSSDTSKIKNDLEKIKNMIVDVKTGTSSVSDATSGLGIDLSGLLDFNISSTGFDLSTLFGGTTTNTSSIANQRGETLYKTAVARCKANVLNTCAAQGVDISIVSNSYDMEIDKHCIAYERSLTESNDQMSATVRNAKVVLQKARLLVSQNKNAYDLRGCVNALDACMQDDYVCGSDYENCLDPTGKYIVNGEVVKGSLPGISGGEYGTTATINGSGMAMIRDTSSNNSTPTYTNAGLYATWDYSGKNAWANGGNLADYITSTVSKTATSIVTPANMTEYLKQKIGYIDNDGSVRGMCASVLNKCQDYTYTGSGNNKKYKDNNDVIRNYLERTMVQIKAKQDEAIADYAEGCISDVSSCLSQNNYNYSYSYNMYNTLTTSNPSNIAIQACMSVINTCKSTTTPAAKTETVYDWLDSALGTTLNTLKAACTDTNSGGSWTDGQCDCGATKGYDASSFKCVNCNTLKLTPYRDSDGICQACPDSQPFVKQNGSTYSCVDDCGNGQTPGVDGVCAATSGS